MDRSGGVETARRGIATRLKGDACAAWEALVNLGILLAPFPSWVFVGGFMQQRRLRLGDILDDYCPRERRITNHAVVAMIDDQVRLTRCTTCDGEHTYKAAHVPKRRKKDRAAGPDDEIVSQTGDRVVTDSGGRLATPGGTVPQSNGGPDARDVTEDDPSSAQAKVDARGEEGRVHRPLIRATLPRQEGQTPARPNPEFTVRQSGGRNGNFTRGDVPGGRRRGRADHGRGPGGGTYDDTRGARARQFQPGNRGPSDSRQFPPGSQRTGQMKRHGKKRSR